MTAPAFKNPYHTQPTRPGAVSAGDRSISLCDRIQIGHGVGRCSQHESGEARLHRKADHQHAQIKTILRKKIPSSNYKKGVAFTTDFFIQNSTQISSAESLSVGGTSSHSIHVAR